MISTISKFAPSVAVGVLLGFLAVWWVAPNTSGGSGLLILIAVLLSTVVHSIIRLFIKPKKP